MKLKAYEIAHRMIYGQYQLLSSKILLPCGVFRDGTCVHKKSSAIYIHLNLRARKFPQYSPIGTCPFRNKIQASTGFPNLTLLILQSETRKV